jgi:hypothetical protein
MLVTASSESSVASAELTPNSPSRTTNAPSRTPKPASEIGSSEAIRTGGTTIARIAGSRSSPRPSAISQKAISTVTW